MSLIKEIVVPQESVNDLFVTLNVSFWLKMELKFHQEIPYLKLSHLKQQLFYLRRLMVLLRYYLSQVMKLKLEKQLLGFLILHSRKMFLLRLINQKKPENIIIPINTIFSEKAIQLMKSYNLTKSDFEGFDFVNTEDVKFKAGINPKLNPGNNIINKQIPIPSIPHHSEKLKISKKREIEYLHHVQSAGLNSQVTIKIDISNIFTSLNKQFRYFKNSLLPIIIYETSRLLRKYPELNAFYNNEEIVYYDEVNIGIALDIDDGLKTINLKQCDSKNVYAIEEELMTLNEKYLSRSLTSPELSGITFTISDLSAESVFTFTPLINRQNSAILGISSVQDDNNCCLTLTFDHRISAGKDASRFLQELKLRIESYKPAASIDVSKIKCYKCFKKLNEDFSEVGFMKVINHKGEESYLCQTCMKGF